MTQTSGKRIGLALLAAGTFAARVVLADATSGAILEGGQEARGMSLADAVTAVDDAGATQINPAAGAALGAPVLAAFVKPEIAGQFTTNFAYAHPLSFGTVSGSFAYKTAGDLTYYAYDPATAVFSKKTVNAGTDILVTGSFARKVWDEIRGGATLKILHSSLLAGAYAANAVAVDLGGSMPVPGAEGATAGLSVRNVGTGLTYLTESEKLPLEARVGGGYAKAFGDYGALAVLDLGYGISAGAVGVGIGVEGTWKSMVSARLGYRYGADQSRYLDVGVGVKWNMIGFDYVLEPMSNSLGFNHGVSLSYNFGAKS